MVRSLLSAVSKLIISAAVIAPDSADLKCCRRTELPLYVQECQPKPEVQKHVALIDGAPAKECKRSNFLEEGIRTIRLKINGVVKEVRKYEDMGRGYVHEGVDNAQWVVDYLGDEEHQAPKGPAIVLGGLTGFIFGLRGGFFKKFIYTSVGALGMAAICYPKEAKEYGGLALDEGEKYATIAYNFVYGVKKGDPPLELPSLPKLPGSASEAFSMVSNLVTSTTTKSASISGAQPEASDATKKVTKAKTMKDDPCEWLAEKKHSGEYREIKNREVMQANLSENNDATLNASKDGVDLYHLNDDTCPCHHGSCMRPTSKEDCPEELPYPPPNCPDSCEANDSGECPECPCCTACKDDK